MSYSAFVICNCFQKGKAIEPPRKEYVKFYEDGLYLDIPENLRKKDEQLVFQIDSDFDKWKNTACVHNEMELCYEYLSNNLGMGEFREVIKRLGCEKRFPNLE